MARQQGEFLAGLFSDVHVRPGADLLKEGARGFEYAHKGSLAYVGRGESCAKGLVGVCWLSAERGSTRTHTRPAWQGQSSAEAVAWLSAWKEGVQDSHAVAYMGHGKLLRSTGLQEPRSSFGRLGLQCWSRDSAPRLLQTTACWTPLSWAPSWDLELVRDAVSLRMQSLR